MLTSMQVASILLGTIFLALSVLVHSVAVLYWINRNSSQSEDS